MLWATKVYGNSYNIPIRFSHGKGALYRQEKQKQDFMGYKIVQEVRS